MHIRVLGSAAGGGFPQWNCNCRNCAGVRHGTVRALPRTQSSIFVRGDDEPDGILFNASPDILTQIRANPALQPGRRLRDTAIAGVVLIDGQVDHATGLYMLRERATPLPLWCTEPVAEDLTTGNPILGVLGHYCGVQRHPIPLDGTPFSVAGVPGLTLRALPLSSKAAPYSPHRDHPVPGDNIGISITGSRRGTRFPRRSRTVTRASRGSTQRPRSSASIEIASRSAALQRAAGSPRASRCSRTSGRK